MEKTITNNPNGYAEIRNIIIDNPEKFIYKKDLFDYGLKIMHLITKRGYHPFWKGFYYNPFDQKTPAHFFNTINLGRNPFKVHFETTLPRLGKAPKWLYRLGIKKLASKNCKEIIAISQCAYDLQIKHLKENYPKYLDAISAKMKVVLPPQKPLIKSYSEKTLPTDKIIFTLVGGDFFRKGGRETLQVFDKLIPLHPNLHLNIVSSLAFGDYATHTTKEDKEEALRIIAKHPSNITHYNSLPNDKVLQLFMESHIGLLPTWADSFGYSVLEAQAAGCPNITTDIRALLEVNNNEIGWVINVPQTENKNALIETEEQRVDFSKLLKNELLKIVKDIVENPTQIEIKGTKSLNEVKRDR